MSTRIMGLCWPLQMRPPAKAVLIALADMANDEGFCWPSLERICERTCFGRTAVIDAIAWLEQHRIVRADRTNGRKTTYWVEPARFTAEAVNNSSDPSATRTGTPRGPVRQTDPTGPPRGLNRSATRTLIVKNRQESKTPQPPADAGDVRAPVQMQLEPETGRVEPAGQTANESGAKGAGGFDAFFKIYPKKKAEMRARRAWNALSPNAALQRMIVEAVGLQAQSEEWKREGGRFVPMASSWLHGERWRDATAVVATFAGAWWESTEGVKAKGIELSLPFSLAALGSAYTDDERGAHWRAYRSRVFAAAGVGPWTSGCPA